MKSPVYNWENKVVGETEVPESVFGARWKPILVEQVLSAQLANRRRPWAHAKDRSEVRGGGRKPWRQKGTGRARHGSIRSPLWIGGGKAHGPHKERDYTEKVNKKMRRTALISALSKKFRDGQIKIFETLALEAPKTKALFGKMKTVLAAKGVKKLDVLFIPETGNKNIFRAAANIQKTKALDPGALNVYDVLNYKHIFVDAKAIPQIQKQYHRT